MYAAWQIFYIRSVFTLLFYAEVELVPARRLRETVLGKEYPSTPTSTNNPAAALRGQDKYEEAEEMHSTSTGA